MFQSLQKISISVIAKKNNQPLVHVLFTNPMSTDYQNLLYQLKDIEILHQKTKHIFFLPEGWQGNFLKDLRPLILKTSAENFPDKQLFHDKFLAAIRL